MQKYHLITQSPWTFKMLFGFVVDARVIQRRKHYLIIFGVIGTIAQLLIFTKSVNDQVWTTVALVVYNFSGAFLDATISSIIVHQGRKDPQNGHQDIQCFSSIFFGISMGFGSMIAAYATRIGKPLYGFGFGAAITGIVTLFSLFMDDTFESQMAQEDQGSQNQSLLSFLGE